MSMRRRGWPVTTRPPPDPAEVASNGWTNVLDQTLQGWEVLDVIQVFEEGDAFLREWHESLGDTCAAPAAPRSLHHAACVLRWVCLRGPVSRDPRRCR